MPSKKVYITLMVILVVFFVLMFCLFGVDNIKQESLSSTIIVGDNTTWSYSKKKWIFLRNHTSVQKYNWTKFHVFEDNKEIGEYLLWHDDKWYVFDENRNAIMPNGKRIAYYANFEMKIADFQETTIDDMTYVEQVLHDHNISTSSKFTSIYQVLLDYDHDGEEENFYIISNIFPQDFEPEISFAIAFMVKDGEIYYLYDDVSGYMGSFVGCRPYYHSFIDTNDDGTYEVIVSCGRYSADDQVDMLFQQLDGEFKLLISNQ